MTGISGSRTAPPLAAARRAFYLARHPATPCEAVTTIEVQVTAKGVGAFELAYAVEGDPGRVRLPETALPRRVDGLWRHTCFEAFIAPGHAAPVASDRTQAAASGDDPHGGRYIELNFSPSGEWAGYAFDGYRRGMRPLEELAAPVITLDRDAGGGRWTVRAAVSVGRFAGARARLGLAAVIEDTGGRLAYWALRHPSDTPDFHHAGGFAADL
jgi:hypothetical protein